MQHEAMCQLTASSTTTVQHQWASDVSLHDAENGAPCSCLDFAEESLCACAACLKLSVPLLMFPC